MLEFFSVFEESLSEKHVMLYFNDKELEEEMINRGWGGETKETNWDFLSVINTNIGGQKSDKKIVETINHVIEVMSDGSITDTVVIKRGHKAKRGELFSGVRNVDWMRVYVPENSELIEAGGFKKPDEIYFEKSEVAYEIDPEIKNWEQRAQTDESSGTKIYKENGKTVFANWLMVDPGEEKTVYLKYKLPFVLKPKEKNNTGLIDKILALANPTKQELFAYSAYYQKQPGSIGSRINSTLVLPENYKSVWKYPNILNSADDGWQSSDVLKTDKYYALILTD
jgi:hypothetical protein